MSTLPKLGNAYWQSNVAHAHSLGGEGVFSLSVVVFVTAAVWKEMGHTMAIGLSQREALRGGRCMLLFQN